MEIMHARKKQKTAAGNKYIDRAHLRRLQEKNSVDGQNDRDREHQSTRGGLDYDNTDHHDNNNSDSYNEQQLNDDDDDYERLLEDALENPHPIKPSNSTKSRSEILSELKRKNNQTTVQQRKSKFRPINRPKTPSPPPAPVCTRPQDEGLKKVKYIKGPDGKMKRMIKRSNPKPTLKQHHVQGERPLNSEQRPPPSKGLSPPPRVTQQQQDNDNRDAPPQAPPAATTTAPQQPATESQPDQTLSEPVKPMSLQEASEGGSDIFSDVTSDYDPFESDSENKDKDEKAKSGSKSSSPPQSHSRDYFSTTGQKQKQKHSQETSSESRQQATSRIIAQAIQETLPSDPTIEQETATGQNEKLVPLQSTDDYGDIDLDLGGEGRWVDDDDEAVRGRRDKISRRQTHKLPQTG